VPIGHDFCISSNLTFGEELDGALVIVIRVGETHPSVGFGGYQNQLLVGAALSPDEGLVDLPRKSLGTKS
jgi:hypothetical protein